MKVNRPARAAKIALIKSLENHIEYVWKMNIHIVPTGLVPAASFKETGDALKVAEKVYWTIYLPLQSRVALPELLL